MPKIRHTKKDGLYQAYLDTVVEGQQHLFEQISRVISEATSVPDALDLVVRHSYRHARNNRQDLHLLCWGSSAEHPPTSSPTWIDYRLDFSDELGPRDNQSTSKLLPPAR